MDSSGSELISRKLIKPSFPTPPTLRNYKLNITDQLISNIYIPVAFFYPNKNNTSSSPNTNISALLENSLSKLLTSYYPFAGRLVLNNLNVDCNDMGATFIEARVHCKMTQISRHTNGNAQDVVFPTGFPWRTKQDESLLVAQLTHFACGGVALSVCLSHKVADALTLYNFSRDWATINRSPGNHKPLLALQLNIASILAPIEDPSIKPESFFFGQAKNIITKRYVFNFTKLSQLKAKVLAETEVQNPTHVEVVTALLYKCAYGATSILHSNSYKPVVLELPINISSLIEQPLSSNYVGNLIDHLILPFRDGIKYFSFSELVTELRRGKVEFYEKMKGVTANEFRQNIINAFEHMRIFDDEKSDFDVYTCSSTCRYSFYNIDFGWGNPDRIIFGAFPIKNIILLMDDQNGNGVEASISLEDEVMDAFDRDPELLQFASTASNKLSNFDD